MTKHNLIVGDLVELISFGPPFIIGTIDRFCKNGYEIEVTHGEDGGGFDFWPIDEVRKLELNLECLL